MANLIVTPTPPTPPTLTQIVDFQLQQAAQAQLRAYNAIRRALYGPPTAPFSADQVAANVTAWATGTTTGLSYTQLQQAAQLAKASLNLFQSVVTDETVPATITF